MTVPDPDATGGTPVTGVRRVTAADVPALTEVLVRSFDDDPVPRFMFRGDRRRRRGLQRFFTIALRHLYLDHGEVWTSSDRSGVALWAPPTKPPPNWRDLLHLLPLVPHVLTGGRAADSLRLLVAVDEARPRQTHWYLSTLGVDPDRQGEGVGSALLAATLARVDADGLPAYLESSKERNVPFYARHGFEVTGEVHGPGGGPTLWLMWREPRPAP